MTAKERKDCMQLLAKLRFAMDDLRLFLDTHPHDRGALAAHDQLRQRAAQLDAALAAAGAPVNFYDAGGQNCWDWAAEPWPWEKEA